MLMGRQYLILHGLGQLCSSEGHDVYSESGERIACFFDIFNGRPKTRHGLVRLSKILVQRNQCRWQDTIANISKLFYTLKLYSRGCVSYGWKCWCNETPLRWNIGVVKHRKCIFILHTSVFFGKGGGTNLCEMWEVIIGKERMGVCLQNQWPYVAMI